MTNPTPITEECLREIEALLAKQTPRPSIALFNAFPDLAAALREAWAENKRLRLDLAAQRCLQDSAYRAGMKAGWNFCVSEDEVGYRRAIDGTEHIAELKRIGGRRAALNPKGDA